MTDQANQSQFTDIPPVDDLAHPKERHDGWSPDKQVTFLEALARTGNVRAAATYAGLSRESAYKLRRRADGRTFARAWDAAIIHARDIFQDALLDKGLNGWSEAVWHQREEVGTRERWSAPLFLAALGRLDKMADGLDVKGNFARAAAENFDALLEGIGQGSDCAELVDEIDGTGRTATSLKISVPTAICLPLSVSIPSASGLARWRQRILMFLTSTLLNERSGMISNGNARIAAGC